MFRDLGRVHIVSFAVGIVGLIIGIVGIVLAIVFGTAQTTCSTPPTPTCPPVTTLPCATNLFGISTTVNNMKYDKAYDNVGGPEWQAAVNNITSTLKDTLNTGLNTQSASSFLRILAATGPTSNNVEVKITSLVPDKSGLVIAIGNGAVSAAVPQGTMPNATNVASVISSDPTTFSNSTATPEVCQPTCQEAQPCTTLAPNCPVCTTQAPPDCSVSTTPAAVQSTTTVPAVVTTTKNGQTSTRAKTTTGIQTSSPAPVVTTTNAATSTNVNTSTPPAPSTTANIGTSPTTKGPSTPGISSTAAITTTKGTIITTTTTISTQAPSTSPLVTDSTQKASSSPSPAPSSTQSKPTSAGSTSAPPNPPTSPTTPAPSTPSAQSTSTAPLPPSTATTVPPTIGPNECYCQSNIAVAVELTNASSTIDLKMQNFIANNLLFYPGNPYKLGKPESGMTQLALVPYPVVHGQQDMVYGIATDSKSITSAFNMFGQFAAPNPEIKQALDFIGNLTYEGLPGYVIIVGNDGTSITNSLPSSEYLQLLGFKVITIGYQSADDFSVLATNTGLSFKISQDSDERVVAQQIGTILYATSCLQSSTSAPKTTTQAPIVTSPIVTSPSTRVPSSSAASSTQPPVTTTIVTSTTAKTPLPSTSIRPVPSSSMGTSSTSPGRSSTSSPQTSSSNPSTSTQAVTTQPPLSSSGSPSTSSQPTTQTPSPNPSTQSTSNGPITSSSSQITSTTLPVQSSTTPGSTPSSGPSTVPPTQPPGVCYYQSNVAVAFELPTSADDIDLQIQDFITNDLFFYGGAPYELGKPSENKTELSLVPYPNEASINHLMAYGSATTPTDIHTLMQTFQVLAMGDNINIADALNFISTNNRTGEPGFVILVANSAVTVQASVDSATKLKSLGFKIITVAFKSAGSFSVLSSDPSYNFQIHQDVDKHAVALAIGNILNTTHCTKPVASTTIASTVPPVTQSTTVTVPQGPTSSPAKTSTVPNESSTSMFRSSSTLTYTTTTAGPTPTTCVCTTVEPGSTTPGYSTSTYATTMGGSSYSTPRVTSGSTPVTSQGTTPGASSSSPSQKSTVVTSPSAPTQSTASTPGASTSSPSQQSSTQMYSTSTPSGTVTTPSGSSTTVSQNTSPSMSSSTVTGPSTLPPTSGPTTSQICPNQQTVFNGQVGVVFELLPSSNQTAVINDFVENILLNSNFYGLAVDNLTGANRTLATAIPYPSTDKYGVGGYGSARSVNDFKNQVIAFNGVIQPVSSTSDIDDALLYITTTLPAGGVKSALIIVGNHGSMIGLASSALADGLKPAFDIYTVAVGDNPAADQLASLSSGDGFNFTGSTQQIADQIGLKLATSNPAIYCPPPVPSTVAPITSTIATSSVSTVTPTIAPTTTVTTVRPTAGPCQCTGRWVYNGDLAIAFEFMNTTGSTNVTNFVQNTFLSSPDSYGLSNDVNGNQPSKLTLIPYPDTATNYQTFGYGSIKKPSDIGNIISAWLQTQTNSTDPAISDAFNVIKNLKTDSYGKVVLLVASDGSDVSDAADSAKKLKDAGYTVITVAQSVSADVFKPLASADKYALKIGDGNDNDVANQIANLLLDISFVCFDDGSSTPSPITRCPTTQEPTQSGTTRTTPAPVASSSTVGSTVTSTAGNTASTSVPVPSTQGPSTASPSASSSTMGSTVGSTVSSGSSTLGSSTSVGFTVTSSTGSTVSSGSTITGRSTMTSIGSTVTGPSSPSGSTVSSASTTSGPSTMSNTGSTTVGSTVTPGSSTMAPSTASPTTSLPTCTSPYKGKIAAVFEVNAMQTEIQDVINFLSINLYNSANYNFTSDTQAVNVPYPNSYSYGTTIGKYGDFTSLAALQQNIDDLQNAAGFTTDADIADGLNYMLGNMDAPGSTAVIIVIGYHEDANFGLTYQALQALRSQGYQVMSVAVGAGHGNLSPIADKPEWYFQVEDSNGQSVADQISSILCNL